MWDRWWFSLKISHIFSVLVKETSTSESIGATRGEHSSRPFHFSITRVTLIAVTSRQRGGWELHYESAPGKLPLHSLSPSLPTCFFSHSLGTPEKMPDLPEGWRGKFPASRGICLSQQPQCCVELPCSAPRRHLTSSKIFLFRMPRLLLVCECIFLWPSSQPVNHKTILEGNQGHTVKY